jgi:cyclic-di-GMP-binding protein
MALSLSVPAATQNPPKDLEIRPKQAKAWVESLPLTKIADSARQVYENLVLLNRAKISAEDRVNLAEVYRPVVKTLLDELEHVFAYSVLPLPGKARDAFELARNLATEFAYPYKSQLLEITGKRIAFGAKKNLPLALHRALGCVRQVVLQSYKTYYPVPANAWRELHQLYALGEENGLLGETPDAQDKASIQDLYIELLMLALADPYRLMQRETDSTLALLAQNRGLITLSAQRPEGADPARIFVVALDSDRAPQLLSQVLKNPSGNVIRALSVSKLIERLKQRLQALAANAEAIAKSRATHDSADLIGRLARLWGDPPKRQFRRNPADSSVALCSGIKAIAYFAELAEKEDPKAEAAAIQGGDTLPLLNIPDDPMSKSIGVEEWIMLNQSANGLKLQGEPGGGVGVSVGEVIGVRFMGGRGWNVGVVRWLNMREDKNLEFGLELIAPTAHPIQIEPSIASSGRPQAALKLPPTSAEDQSEALITFPDTFSDLREFELSDRGQMRLVRATTLVEKTTRFDLFQFAPS